MSALSPVFQALRGKLVVSCQALPDEPLHSPFIMGRMALAASQAGAAGIRANTVADIKAIRENVRLPIIGIIKADYPDSEVYITPTEAEVEALVAVGAEIIALDATRRPRPNGRTLETMFPPLRARYPDQLFMADCATVAEAAAAERLGFDCVGTTLAGYTAETRGTPLPALFLLDALRDSVRVPIVAEGGIQTPEQLRQAFAHGAWTAVVGGAITRPQEIAARFVAALEG